jgi:hypothetical protein
MGSVREVIKAVSKTIEFRNTVRFDSRSVFVKQVAKVWAISQRESVGISGENCGIVHRYAAEMVKAKDICVVNQLSRPVVAKPPFTQVPICHVAAEMPGDLHTGE